jgi:glycosyltransferase involved in cell wall biosynthesis
MISIVMSYYNRLSQLQYTLKTMQQSATKDFEIVIVDDFSDAENSLDHITDQYPDLMINVIRMRDLYAKKNYCNPCVPYNVGLRASRGQQVIIQNPECCHVGDVISYVQNHCHVGSYLSFHCWSCVKHETRQLQETGTLELIPTKKSRWYNHETERPVAFHFCSAISRQDLVAINGFDERYALGHNWDDAEILHRIKRICVVKFVSDPYVIHQYHHKSYGHPDNIAPQQNNKDLYFAITESGPTRAPNKESIT